MSEVLKEEKINDENGYERGFVALEYDADREEDKWVVEWAYEGQQFVEAFNKKEDAEKEFIRIKKTKEANI